MVRIISLFAIDFQNHYEEVIGEGRIPMTPKYKKKKEKKIKTKGIHKRRNKRVYNA